MLTRDNRLYLAWVVAIVATLGSLYFSEIKGFKPCPLCWYQRIAMYPLVLVLGAAALTGDLGVRRYVLPLAGVGLFMALFQNLETWGVIPTIAACTADPMASCSVPWPIWGGGALGVLNTIITIPVLSMIAFTLIILLLSWRRARM